MKFLKHLLLLALIAMPVALNAQTATGQWVVHSKFVGTDITNCIDTGDKVYYLTSNSLYYYDKETQENAALDKSNYLNDSKVTQIYYNYDKKYLVIAYESSNIDIILDDADGGKIINMSEIRDAMMTVEKSINDITFAGDNIMVATAFGYVVINDRKWEVKESRVFNTSINSIAQVGDWVLLTSGSNYYYGKASERYDKLSDYNVLAGAGANGKIYPINNTRFFLCATNLFGLRTISPKDDGTITITATAIASATPITVQPYPDGYVASFATYNTNGSVKNNFYYTSDAAGDNRKRVTATEIYSSTEQGNWWVIGKDGLAHIVGGQKSEYLKPNGLSIAYPVHMALDERNNKLYVVTTAADAWLKSERQSWPAAINTLQGSTWTDILPQGLPSNTKYTTGFKYPIFDPNNPDKYYLCNWWHGMHVIEKGNYLFSYDADNSTMSSILNGYYNNVDAVFDRYGNLWAVQTGADGLNVLPAAKVGTQTTEADWEKVPAITNIEGHKRTWKTFLCTKDNIKIFNNGSYAAPFIFWDDKGNWSGDITSNRVSRFVDQDGKGITWTYVSSMVEDKQGRVWFTHLGGLGYFDPKTVFDADFHVIRPKVNRNDGTNMADYLLDAIEIHSISVDGNDNKWIGTVSDGVYVVNADGSEVLEHFTSSNSSLPSDAIYEVVCNPNNNTVYFTTAGGFAEYRTEAIDAAEDYSNVVAYPNPVRPDYTGLITIKGLMANSLVKIADNSGNVVKQLKSNGGIVTWDGCNEAGDRVETGVYFVLASQNEDGSGSANVTKILIVR